MRTIILIQLAILMICLLFGCREKPEERFKRLVREATACEAEEDYNSAIAALKNALDIKPQSAQVYRKLGCLYVSIGELFQATQAFCHATTMEPDVLDSWFELGKLYLASKNVESAKRCWGKIKAIPDNTEKYIFHGDLMVLDKKLYLAEASYKRALEISGDSPRAIIRLAICYLAQRKTKQAENTYNLLLPNYDGPDIFLQMAEYWKMKGDYEKAEMYIIRASNSAPEDIAIQKAAVEYYYCSEKFRKARDILEKATQKNPQNRFIKKFMAETLLHLNLPEQAWEIISVLSENNESDIEINLLKGKYHLMVSEPGQALSDFFAVVQEEPNLPVAHYLLGISYLAKGMANLSKQSFIKALSLNPFYTDAELALSDFYYKARDYKLSMEHVKRVIQREPENIRCHLILGNIYLAQNQFPEAEKAFEVVRRIDPDTHLPLYFIARASEKSKQKKEAIRYYRKILEQHPELADATMRYAVSLVGSGQIETAETYLKEAVERDPTNAFLHFIFGEVNYISENFNEARYHFDRALTINPGLPRAYYRLAGINEEIGNSKESARILKACIEHNPHFEEGYHWLADYYVASHNRAKAIETLEKSLNINPLSPHCSKNLAWLYLKENIELNRALKLARFAVEKYPDDPAALDTLGQIYYKNKLYDMAICQFSKSISINPDRAGVHFRLGMAYHEKGTHTDAVKSMRQAIELKLPPTLKERAEEVLAALESGKRIPDTRISSST